MLLLSSCDISINVWYSNTNNLNNTQKQNNPTPTSWENSNMIEEKTKEKQEKTEIKKVYEWTWCNDCPFGTEDIIPSGGLWIARATYCKLNWWKWKTLNPKKNIRSVYSSTNTYWTPEVESTWAACHFEAVIMGEKQLETDYSWKISNL